MRKTTAIGVILVLICTAVVVADPFPPFDGPNHMGISSQHVTIGDSFNTSVWADIHSQINTIAADNFTFLPAGVITYENVSKGNLFAGTVMWVTPLWIHNDTGWAKTIMWAYNVAVNSTNATAFNITWNARAVGAATFTITKGGTAYNGTDPGTTKHSGIIYVHPQGVSSFNAIATNPNSIYISWAKGTAMDRTVIRGSKTGYPVSPTSDTDVYNNTGASTTHSGLNPLETWYYSAWGWNATKGYFSISYQTDSDTTPSANYPPYKPITPVPANNTAYMNVYNIWLNCTVSDPDVGVLDVHYYWGNGSFIGTITGVSSGSISSLFLPTYWHRSKSGYNNLTWVTHDVNHTWYAVADDGEYTTQSPTWHFKTNKAWDFDANKVVNYLDVSALVSHYALRVIPPGKEPWDINEDTYTNYLDVSSLVSHYGEHY